MIHHPGVMARAQIQIDEVVGTERMPTFADRPDLPYVDAIVKEILRWRTVGPLAVPRSANQVSWFRCCTRMQMHPGHLLLT